MITIVMYEVVEVCEPPEFDVDETRPSIARFDFTGVDIVDS